MKHAALAVAAVAAAASAYWLVSEMSWKAIVRDYEERDRR